MKKIIILFILLGFFYGCKQSSKLEQYGLHYQKYKDYKSLESAMYLFPKVVETGQVKKILGEPIDNGFDYRYLVDSLGENNCPVGAVFNIDAKGSITNRWLGEICE